MAETIGKTLADTGAAVDVHRVQSVKTLDGYDYIVYGILNDMPVGHKRYSLKKAWTKMRG